MSLVKLIGLDFGTTTSSAVMASARLTRNAVTGRMDLDQVREIFRSELVFTPMEEDRLDVARLEEYLEGWLTAGQVRPEEVFGGGALLTGLAAQKANAAVLVHIIRQRLGNALIATADDPCLESWLAFQGSCGRLSRSHSDLAILNLDVGGGTTNLALGKGGEVFRTGCLFVGARHVQVVPGTYRIVKISPYAQALFDHLGIRKGPGNALEEAERDAVLDFYIGLLEAEVSGTVLQDPLARLHHQVWLGSPEGLRDVVVTFSGGVGELIYAHMRGKPWPPPTCFGDLGIDLGQRLVRSPVLNRHLAAWQPDAAGRATVYGLLRHTTEISGSTLFLPRPEILPLTDMPILGTFTPESPAEHMCQVVELVQRSARGGCIRLHLPGTDAESISRLACSLRIALGVQSFPPEHPLVLLVRENVGKILGHYVTAWGAFPLNLVVIDEIAVRNAHYAQIGRLRDQVLPVSFYGLHESVSCP